MKSSELSILTNKLILTLLMLTAALSLPQLARAEMQLSQFETGSYKKIMKLYQDDAFLLVLWSVDCPPCIDELPALGRFHQQHPKANLVMVSTDSNNQQADIRQLMDKYGLTDIQQWVFAGDSAQAIRFAIDPLWYGELPRSYFHHEDNKRQAKTGKLDEDTLLAWLRAINYTTAGL